MNLPKVTCSEANKNEELEAFDMYSTVYIVRFVSTIDLYPLRIHAYSNILKISSPKTKNFPIKTSDIFHISAQKIDCGYSLEPPCRGSSNK